MWHILRSERWFPGKAAVRVVLALALCLGSLSTVRAAWLEDYLSGGTGGVTVAADQLARAHAIIAKQEARAPALVLAAEATAEGHWTFVNKAGQRYTTANQSELSRLYQNLAPDIRGRPAPVVIYLTGRSVFAHGEHLAALPVDARLRVVAGQRSFPLRGYGRGEKRSWFAEVRPNVLVRALDQANFDEAVWQLQRPLAKRVMRVLALEPGAPDSFRPFALTKKNGVTRQQIDKINPAKLVSALPTLRRQTAVITGRLKGSDTLVYRTATGAEQELALQPLRQAAAEADANLVLVNAAAPRQPGMRNWLWLKVEVEGLVEALSQATLGDFINALAGGTGELFVEASASGDDRVRLRVVPMRAGVVASEPDLISSVLAELVSEVAGSVLAHAVDADVVSMQRQKELDQRLLPGVTSRVQWGFGLAMLAGLIGLPVALGWWRRIWMPEVRSEYATGAGFEMARAVRWLVFFCLFLPIAGVPAALWSVARGALWLLGGGRGREKADADTVTG